MPFISFTCTIAAAKTFHVILYNRRLHCFPQLIWLLWLCHIQSLLHFLVFLICQELSLQGRIEFYQIFLWFIEMINFFFHSADWIMFIDLIMLNHSCISRTDQLHQGKCSSKMIHLQDWVLLVLSICMYICTAGVFLVPKKAIGYWIPWNWSYRHCPSQSNKYYQLFNHPSSFMTMFFLHCWIWFAYVLLRNFLFFHTWSSRILVCKFFFVWFW